MGEISIHEFADKMNEVMPVTIKEFSRRQANELYKGKITLQQFLVLEFLHRHGESKMKDLADFLHISTAAMTGIGDRLVRDGYAVRIDDPEDRRITRVKLTAKGDNLVKKISHQRREMVVDIFGQLSGQDRRDYLRILMQVKDILLKGNGKAA
jgi:DNA-binding MarR family transcriptional regulator